MSTRAMYTFRDETSEYHVYKHHDGYPTGAAQWIEAALPLAWQLPRFEADEFAAAFVAANKRERGGERLMHSGSVYAVAPIDIEYRYEVTCKAGKLQVKAFKTSFWSVRSKTSEKRIFQGTLAAFKDAAEELERPGGVGAAWTYIAIAPDGRELARETGGRDAEARVEGVAARFNRDLPRGAKALAVVRVVPADAIERLERPGGVGAQRLGIYWTPKSVNKKTGPIPVSTTSAETCPSACPLAKAGCYAKGGNVGILWHALTRHGPNAAWKHGASMARSIDWAGLCQRVAALEEGALWRHNQAGDLPHRKQRILKGQLVALVRANRGKRGWTYTHHIMSTWNRALVRWANATGFTINLSANTLAHADELADADAGPVVVVQAFYAPRQDVTPAGRVVRTCPATYAETTCKRCQWCAIAGRDWIVGFPPHGSGARAANAVAEGT